MDKPDRRTTNIDLDAAMLDEAEALDVDVASAAEKGLAADLKQARQAKWKAENREAIEKSNAYVEEHGIPFADHRKF